MHESTDSTVTLVAVDYSCSDQVGLLQALATLDADFQIVRKTIQINRVRQFRNEVTGLAARHGAEALQTWSSALAAALASFNINQIKAEFGRYEILVAGYSDASDNSIKVVRQEVRIHP